MKYYLPTFDEIDSLRKDYVDVFLAARRVNSMFIEEMIQWVLSARRRIMMRLKMMMKWSIKDDCI